MASPVFTSAIRRARRRKKKANRGRFPRRGSKAGESVKRYPYRAITPGEAKEPFPPRFSRESTDEEDRLQTAPDRERGTDRPVHGVRADGDLRRSGNAQGFDRRRGRRH